MLIRLPASIAAIVQIDNREALGWSFGAPARGWMSARQPILRNALGTRFHTERPDTPHGQLRAEPNQPRANPPGGLPDGYGKQHSR